MAELHVFGQIESAESFKQSSLFCKWSFHSGNGWKLINGNNEGQTQECRDLYKKKLTWNHPVDLHYSTQTIQGSPKILIQVYSRDNYGRILFIAYGTSCVPLIPGYHEIKCHTWKPIGNWQDRLRDKFLGITLQLKSPSLLANSTDRFELLTETEGIVNIQLHIMCKNFDKFGCLM
ncbi:B9 domain-containing protein 2 [Chelonus insularis]|uniref:B9 domain-containing protein 2 n=1 Tax=Chelonus insularis TaxID=460826 RepID=UPI0015892DAC|nr:B9 domain-containing protein 2 [Chelonus insularis]